MLNNNFILPFFCPVYLIIFVLSNRFISNSNHTKILRILCLLNVNSCVIHLLQFFLAKFWIDVRQSFVGFGPILGREEMENWKFMVMFGRRFFVNELSSWVCSIIGFWRYMTFCHTHVFSINLENLFVVSMFGYVIKRYHGLENFAIIYGSGILKNFCDNARLNIFLRSDLYNFQFWRLIDENFGKNNSMLVFLRRYCYNGVKIILE